MLFFRPFNSMVTSLGSAWWQAAENNAWRSFVLSANRNNFANISLGISFINNIDKIVSKTLPFGHHWWMSFLWGTEWNDLAKSISSLRSIGSVNKAELSCYWSWILLISFSGTAFLSFIKHLWKTFLKLRRPIWDILQGVSSLQL